MTTTPRKRKLESGIRLELGDPQHRSYAQVLQLERILNAQRPFQQPPSHDEMLFIIIHQVAELWLKLMYHELAAARADIARDQLGVAFKKLARVKAIQSQMISAWDVLRTMTPADYLRFRDALGPSSGFQSYGYRLVEFALGNKDADHIKVHRYDPEIHARLTQALAEPSLYDETLKLLARRGFAIAPQVLERDLSKPYQPHDSVLEAWLAVYRDCERHWDLYNLAEKLVDIEDNFQHWRFNHLQTVKRIIGHKRGTGGSSGVPFLEKALGISFFPELYQVRTAL
ncbi:MAG TPA: tryptophan 2,3-dioxygenase family protein [Candidatus Competibacteraceae bacterium]|nr:tryptophan 2,3-dioxygenase family protein [Candidatus Competibacteraceae bacterium]